MLGRQPLRMPRSPQSDADEQGSRSARRETSDRSWRRTSPSTAATADRRIFCWGPTRDESVPRPGGTRLVPPTERIEHTGATGAGRFFARPTPTRVLRCLGSNYFGQLGDGTTEDSLTPVEVVGTP